MAHEPRREQQRRAATQALPSQELLKREYEQLALFRHTLRQFSRHTELEARRLGLTPQQYQLLLAIKGFPNREWASISELAERLQIRHNAVIGLVNRAELRGFVRRVQDAIDVDRRIVQIHLTPDGDVILRSLAMALRYERRQVQATLYDIDQQLSQLESGEQQQ